MKTILFVDGENFKKKIISVVATSDTKEKPAWHEYNFAGLFNQVLQGIVADERIFYGARIGMHPQTEQKSRQLIESQRLMKAHLERQGFKFVFGGRVRGNVIDNAKGKEITIFREKGVDVQIAVDLISMACDGDLKTAIIASSDSDLQPAIKVLRRKGIECIYLGFELEPNKGLTYTTKRTILIRNSEVLQFLPANFAGSLSI
ncbi:MAG TPA: NYN domain-containing protein [Candidatus Paceibacterota bacterium]